jgi:hypothetical protein
MQKDGVNDSGLLLDIVHGSIGWSYFTRKGTSVSSAGLSTGGFARLTGTSIAASTAALALSLCPMSLSCFCATFQSLFGLWMIG